MHLLRSGDGEFCCCGIQWLVAEERHTAELYIQFISGIYVEKVCKYVLLVRVKVVIGPTQVNYHILILFLNKYLHCKGGRTVI